MSTHSPTCQLRPCRRLLAFAVLCGILAAPTFAQLSRDEIEQALDRPIDALAIEETKLLDALTLIEEKTGITFELDPAARHLMPYGRSTRVSIEIRDLTAREGLQQVFDGLGLQMVVEDGAVRLEPAPVLDRLGRRTKLPEVALLGRLATNTWDELMASEDLTLEFHIPPDKKPRETLEAALALNNVGSALDTLDAVAASLDWSWVPQSDRVVFERQYDQINRRLDRPVDLTYQHTPLDDVFVDLGTRVGVTMLFEPGVLQAVGAHDRHVDLIQHGVSVRQTLERLCGSTGLRYEVEDDGVRIYPPPDDANGPTAATIQQWVRIEIEIRPGIRMDIFVRQDKLPREFREEAERKLQAILHGEE